jgi:hypothetical protein
MHHPCATAVALPLKSSRCRLLKQQQQQQQQQQQELDRKSVV